MKKLFILMFFVVYLTSIHAQDIDLLENNWYLEKLLIENEEVFPPISNCSDFSEVFFDTSQIELNDGCCKDGVFSAITYMGIDGFELSNKIGLLLEDSCSADEREFADNHFGVYYNETYTDVYNPYNYEITADGDDLALIVTNGIGDKAYYNNVLLNTTDYEKFEVNIYPNPVATRLYVTSQDPITQLRVYAINGQELLQVSNVEAGLDVSVLNAGIYFVEIVTQDGKAIQQFIKK